MKASKLVEELQKLIEEHGDLDIVHHDEDELCDYIINCISVRHMDFSDAMRKVISIY